MSTLCPQFKDEQMHEQAQEMTILLQDHYGEPTNYGSDFTRYWDRLQKKVCGLQATWGRVLGPQLAGQGYVTVLQGQQGWQGFQGTNYCTRRTWYNYLAQWVDSQKNCCLHIVLWLCPAHCLFLVLLSGQVRRGNPDLLEALCINCCGQLQWWNSNIKHCQTSMKCGIKYDFAILCK